MQLSVISANTKSPRSMTLHNRIISLKQYPEYLQYRTIRPVQKPSKSTKASTPEDEDDTESLLRHYLNLTPNLTTLYEHWSSVDPNFKKRAPKFTGVRILKQDGWEALVSFICSSNNNIVRISQMVRVLITAAELVTKLYRSTICVYIMAR